MVRLVAIKDNLFDMFTKPLLLVIFNHYLNLIRISSISKLETLQRIKVNHSLLVSKVEKCKKNYPPIRKELVLGAPK